MLKVFQQEEEDVLDHCRRFKGLTERAEVTCGKVEPMKAAKRDPECSKDADKTLEETNNKMLACAFVDGAGRAHRPLLKDLEQDCFPGEGKHPATMKEALQVLTAFED